ncbi:MAG: hypothetical protein EZS28_024984 [Streblomastix strix]|uniref:RRM domain-containing protein n=1 Tax=Streblomastix strix TaxID=222440 RepID=A0A5J4VA73_9EUKA|nr:MAG: hypothetical protein EZS28_024984 [Streblomastix strix]
MQRRRGGFRRNGGFRNTIPGGGQIVMGGGGFGQRGAVYQLVEVQPPTNFQGRRSQFVVAPQRNGRFNPAGFGQRRQRRTSEPFGSRVSGTKVIVNNLHQNVDEAALRDHLSRSGTIQSITLDKEKQQAEVVFTRMSDAQNCVELFSGIKFFEQAITLELAVEAARQGGGWRGRGGRGIGGRRNRGGFRGPVTADQLDQELDNYMTN